MSRSPKSKVYKLPPDLAAAITKEARRLKRPERIVLRYWLRLGMQTQPQIQGVLP
jgi:hypothetical protein